MKTTKSEAKVNTSTEKAIKFDTKATLKAKLKKLLPVVVRRDDALAHTIDYALSRAKTTRDELADLFNQVDVLLSEPVAENQVKPKKPTPKSKKVKEEEEPENPEVIVDADEDEEEQPKTSKKSLKSKVKKTDKVEEMTPISSKSVPSMAKIFPKEIVDKNIGTLVAVPKKYHSYKELTEALEKGVEIYFATYWTPRLLKEFNYATVNRVGAVKSFPHDLDLLVAVVPCETIDRVWCMSQYTEAMYSFEGEDLVPVKDKDTKTGEEFAIRVSNGMEFEIYELVSED